MDTPSNKIEEIIKDPTLVFSLKYEDMSKSMLMEFFSKPSPTKPPRLPSNTKIIIDDTLVKKYNSVIGLATNYNEIKGKETTVGRVLVHQFLVDILSEEPNTKHPNLGSFLPFNNTALTKKVLGKQNNRIASLLIDGHIDHTMIKQYTDRQQWLGYSSATFSLPSLDLNTVAPSRTILDYRNKLLKQHKEEIDKGNLKVMNMIEKDVLAFANKQLDIEKANGKLIYDSGFNGDFNNNYKVTSIFRGIAPRSDSLSEFNIVTSSLSDGIDKRDIAAHADIGVTGASGRAKDTQLAGYKTKIFNAAFGSVVIDKEGTDCKSNRTILVEITEKNYSYYRNRYVVTANGTLDNLNEENKAKYIGRKVKMRTPLYCTSELICNKCMGDMQYKLKSRNSGLMVSRITTNLMNKSMKAFHNLAVEPLAYNLMDYME